MDNKIKEKAKKYAHSVAKQADVNGYTLDEEDLMHAYLQGATDAANKQEPYTLPAKFIVRAKDAKTDLWVYGDLANVDAINFRSRKLKYYIVSHHANGGMMYISKRVQINPNTVQILKGFTCDGEKVWEDVEVNPLINLKPDNNIEQLTDK